MRHFLLILSLISLSIMDSARAETATTPPPQCPPDPRTEDVPELSFTYESFDEEAFVKDLAALKQHLPKWIEEKSVRLRNADPDNDNSKIFDGELWMAYTNTLNGVVGYILKLEYLTADELDRAEKEKAFCDFIKDNIIID